MLGAVEGKRDTTLSLEFLRLRPELALALAEFFRGDPVAQRDARPHSAAQQSYFSRGLKLIWFLRISTTHTNLANTVSPPFTLCPSVTSTRQPAGR